MKTKVFILILLSVFSTTVSSGQKNNQKIIITGRVLNKAQIPMANAIIMIDGKKTNHVTNSRGNYKIKVEHNAEKIGIFTTLSGVTEEIISGRTRVNFTLGVLDSGQQFNQEKVTEEEGINVGYGKAKKKDITGSVSKIDATNTRYASYNSIYDMIRGELAGVRVEGKSIKVQGATSISESTQPLLIVDGITVSSLDMIQPQMVKSIEVLKGSSASIYGARGANGVILINLITSKGNK